MYWRGGGNSVPGGRRLYTVPGGRRLSSDRPHDQVEPVQRDEGPEDLRPIREHEGQRHHGLAHQRDVRSVHCNSSDHQGKSVSGYS